jgi:predicted DNA-binding protein
MGRYKKINKLNRKLSVRLSEEQYEKLDQLKNKKGAKTIGEVVRLLIDG